VASVIWLLTAATILCIAFGVAAIVLAPGKADLKPTIVGGFVLLRAGQRLQHPPIVVYVGNEHTRSAALSINLTTGPEPVTARLLYSNIKPDTWDLTGSTLVGEPHRLGVDTAFYSLHEGFQRTIFAVDVAIPPGTTASIASNVADFPQRETYTTRRIAISPPINSEIIARAQQGGFEPVWPFIVSVQRVTNSTGFTTTGGQPIQNNALGAILEGRLLTQADPIVRAFWTNERARSWQTFWLFVLAAVAGLGFAALLEAVGPWINALTRFGA
jgi:hypothetical protein